MSDPRDVLRLTDIADQIDFVTSSLIGKTFDEFIADRHLYQSIAFSLQVIGEAANNLSDDARSQAPNVPWAKIIALRNRIVHGYFSIELSEIWRIATNDAAQLRTDLTAAGFFRRSEAHVRYWRFS